MDNQTNENEIFNEDKKERALLISVDTGDFNAEISMEELEELAKTAGAEVVGTSIQKRQTPVAATYIGKGALYEMTRFCENMNIDLVLHMDPVKVNDPETELYRAKVVEAIHQIDPKWGFHDFRIVSGPTHVNLVFDLVIPFEEKYSQEEIEDMLLKLIQSDKKIYLVLTIDHPYA